MASVAYNGVDSASGGNIFKDIIFWVAQRVPMRSHMVFLIKSNGGKVVPLEKDAHMLIADHVRKDAPAESYSWKYITESVDNGIAQLTDHYRIWGHPEEARPRAGGSAPVKNTRTPFTAADDAALANWVLSHTQGQTGNKIYQEFEETHSWHTWQSWRNRYSKKLILLPRADLERLVMSAADLAVQDTASSNHSHSKPTTPIQPAKPTPVKRQAKKSAEKAPKSPPKKAPTQSPKSAERAATGTTSTRPSRSNVSNGGSAGGQAADKNRTATDGKSPTTPKSAKNKGVTEDGGARAAFYIDLAMFIEDCELDIDMQPVVDGETVDLWHLSQAVASQKVPIEEVDWMKVAEDLDYDWVRNKGVPDELQGCYNSCLADFFEAMDSFAVDEDEPASEFGKRPDLLTLGDDIPSSPPLLAVGRKRSLELESRSSAAPSSKRRRLSKDAEVPSTPDDKLGVASTMSPSVQRAMQLRSTEKRTAATPRSKRAAPAVVSATDGAGSDQAQQEEDAIVFETQVQPIPRLETQQSTFEVTPSQQLHSEALEVSPVPLRLRETPSKLPAERETAHSSMATASKRAPRRSLPSSFQPSHHKQATPKVVESRAQKPSQPSRPRQPTEEDASQGISETIEYYEMLGYPRSIVVETLMRTTMTPGWPASYVMEQLKAKEGVPTNVEGVWTDRDDKSLRYADAVEARKATANNRELNKAKKELDRIVHKHNQERVDLRRQFLEAQAMME